MTGVLAGSHEFARPRSPLGIATGRTAGTALRFESLTIRFFLLAPARRPVPEENRGVRYSMTRVLAGSHGFARPRSPPGIATGLTAGTALRFESPLINWGRHQDGIP